MIDRQRNGRATGFAGRVVGRLKVTRFGAVGLAILGGLSVLGLAGSAETAAAQEAETTRVVIRAVASDAKIIGDGVGGARITVVDAVTGAKLAEGVQRGNTGDTRRIMSTPHGRDMTVYDTQGAASFVAELELTEPTLVNISAAGPLGFPQAMQTATVRMLVVPGGHIEGDGVVLTLHGFIVEIQEPQPLAPVADRIPVRARVEMMCGCPLTPGGMWDSNGVEIRARLLADGRPVAESTLEFAGQPSTFRGELRVPASARGRQLEVEVLAADPEKANGGRHALPIQLQAG